MMNWAASPLWAFTLHREGGYALMSKGRRRPPTRSSRVTRVAFFRKDSSATALARMSRAIGGTGGRRFALHQA